MSYNGPAERAPSIHEDDNWSQRAACKGVDPDVFFPDQEYINPYRLTQGAERALAVCARCMVADKCLEEELQFGPSSQVGIRGNTTARQRKVMLGWEPRRRGANES